MKYLYPILVLLICLGTTTLFAQEYSIVLHGGAGDGIIPENFDQAKQELYAEKMREAIKAGEAVLKQGGGAVDAVVAVLTILEDSPLFNAGRGAVLTWEGNPELDASIMDGRTLNAGAIAGVSRVKNPIKAARLVMDSSAHVLLSRNGAEAFAKVQNVEMVEPAYFKTDERVRSLQRYKQGMGYQPTEAYDYSKLGTVGCVVMDQQGHIAAGTSTGGMTGKRYGRIGDSPIVGAGTYASDQTCGISCTGHGEYFIRYAVAHDLHARLKYSNQSLEEAAELLIQEELLDAGGKGGIIGIDREGNIVMEFNTAGMFRAFVQEGDTPEVLFFKN
jgi:beta-aspartyl-peptidase (threonine type)